MAKRFRLLLLKYKYGNEYFFSLYTKVDLGYLFGFMYGALEKCRLCVLVLKPFQIKTLKRFETINLFFIINFFSLLYTQNDVLTGIISIFRDYLVTQ